MIESIFTYATEALTGSLWVSVFGAFTWGLLSILLSPCHLSSIPLIIGFISSRDNLSYKNVLLLSLVFAVGILITIAVIGAVTAALGRLMGDLGSIGNTVIAVIFFIVGLYLLGVIRLPFDGMNIKTTHKKGYTAAFILGLLIGIGLGPCTFAFMAPVLGVVLQTVSVNFLYALALLSAFAAGHCFVIVLAGTMAKKVQSYLNWTETSKTATYIKKICGILVIGGGLYILYINFF